jgi:hypothetical protein
MGNRGKQVTVPLTTRTPPEATRAVFHGRSAGCGPRLSATAVYFLHGYHKRLHRHGVLHCDVLVYCDTAVG